MKHLTIFVLSTAFVCADPIPETSSVSSTTAAYDGNALVLKGHVVLDHSLGKMTADQASLERQDAGKEFPFSLIHLTKDVLLSLKNKSEIQCQEAQLDFTALTGTLSSQDKVIFTKELFRLMSPLIELNISKKEEKDFEIETMHAKNSVIIDYASNFTLRADHAFYHKDNQITAHPKDENTFCHLTHQGDQIDATSVDFDLPRSLLTLHNPKGTLVSCLVPNVQKGEIHFTCKDLVWNHLKNLLILKGEVHIDETSLGTLTSEDELHLVQTKQKGKRVTTAILAKGNTMLQYTVPETKTAHTLVSHGALYIDRDKLQAIIESPVVDGKIANEQQIHYEEEEIAIHADKAAIEYTLEGTRLLPVSMNLKGNIRLFSHDPNKPLRCGIADRLSYSPSTRTLILAANPGKKVLFCDEEQALRITGHEIHITQDPETKKQTVKGIGNVKFSFSTDEDTLLKHIFPNYKGL